MEPQITETRRTYATVAVIRARAGKVVWMDGTPAHASVNTGLVNACQGVWSRVPEDEASVADFVAGARYHRIAPLAHVTFREHQPEIAQLLQADRDRALMNHLRMSALLGRISKLLDGIDWLVFKGPVLSEFAHPVPGLRFYKDLDVLVSPADFRRATNRLLEAGWRVLVSDDSLRSGEFPGEIPLMDAHGIVMDLHWSMIVMRSVRGRFPVSAEPLLERRVPATLGPVKLSVLDPVDALVHVCHHAALVGATKLGHILDADQLARSVTDWEAVTQRAHDWGAQPQVAVVLGRARHLFATPMPDDLGRSLALGPGLSLLMMMIDRVWPVPGLRKDESWVRLATRAVRSDLVRTAGVVVRNAGQGLVTRLRRADSDEPRFTAAPGVIEEYLARVEASAS